MSDNNPDITATCETLPFPTRNRHGLHRADVFRSEANHGFHNDSTSRYDEAQAELAWKRTIAFFKRHLAE